MVLLLMAHCSTGAEAPPAACSFCGRRPGLLARLRARFRRQKGCPDDGTSRRPIHHLVAELQCRYGPQGGVVVAIAAAVFAAIPLPGTTLIPFGIAELTTKRSRDKAPPAVPAEPGP
jgi:hypothetical protein